MNEKAKVLFSGEGEQEVIFNVSVEEDGEMTVGMEFEPPIKNDDEGSSLPQVVLAVRFMEFLRN